MATDLTMKELGPKWDGVTQQARDAEIARRQLISNSLLARTPEQWRISNTKMALAVSAKSDEDQAETHRLRVESQKRAYNNRTTEKRQIQLANLNVSAEQRAQNNIAQSITKTGRKASEIGVIKKSVIWNQVGVYIARGASSRMVSFMTGVPVDRITAAKAVVRSESQKVDLPMDSESVKRRRIDARKEIIVDDSPEIIAKKNALANALRDAGLISFDVSSWALLLAFYEGQGRQLPEYFADQIRLEVFFKARKAAKDGDSSLLERYSQIGEEIDAAWFRESLSEEQEFINVANCTHRWMLGDPNDGIVLGDCKRCGEHKEFSNRIEDNRSKINGKVNISL